MPFASSWKGRESRGAGTARTPLSMFSTMEICIHWNSNSTLASVVLRSSRLCLSSDPASIRSNLKAFTSPARFCTFRSSRSARAALWSMLNSRTSLCLNLMSTSPSTCEYLRNDTSEAQVSNHSERILCVAVVPETKRLYAWDVRKTMRKPTKKLKPAQGWDCLRMLSSFERISHWNLLMLNLMAAVRRAHGSARRSAAGKTLPRILHRFARPMLE
mmetsp:Transcript_77746/g.175762  ORF Transcript_77746/g.175762 Transcript_77746/m.175762 type:complete len:216 (+) Transcript_77746:884-1531(+)